MPGNVKSFGKSHLGGRKSSTGVGISVFWQLGKFLDKAIDIVPATKLMRMNDDVSIDNVIVMP